LAPISPLAAAASGFAFASSAEQRALLKNVSFVGGGQAGGDYQFSLTLLG